MQDKKKVLAVDLDGTLLRSDLLFESVCYKLSMSFFYLFQIIKWLFSGKANLKARLADGFEFDPALLPFRRSVIDFIEQGRNNGAHTVLISASNEHLVSKIAEFLECFDEAFGSDDKINLKGVNKAKFLVDRYGVNGFDYIGDSIADIPVWKEADKVLIAGASKRVIEKVSNIFSYHECIEEPLNSKTSYVKILRPHQWLKNLLVFAPLIAAHSIELEDWFAGFIGFIAFNLIASSVYILNDLLDLAADRQHPRKSIRPFAAGDVPIKFGLLTMPLLIVLGAIVASYLPLKFALILVAYYIITLLYSFFLKRRVLVDIFTLTGLYTLRVVAGASATGLILSPWIVAFCLFLFLALAAIKRQTELVSNLSLGQLGSVGRDYKVDDLLIIVMIALSSGCISVLVFALYINSPAVISLYSSPWFLWGACPILLYWIIRLVLLAHRGDMHDDPVIFATKDKVSVFCGVIIVICGVLGSIV
mgnify:CR=1 FL=1